LSGNRLGLLVRLHQALPAARTLLISDSPDLGMISRAFRVGVWGVLTRERAAEDLEYAMLAVTRDELWLSRGQLSSLVRLTAVDDPSVVDILELTPRENAVVRGVLSGQSNKQIACMLDIAEHTVKVHLHHIYGKLHLHRRVDLLIRYGREAWSCVPFHRAPIRPRRHCEASRGDGNA
jgi:two-component system nitrate/nitrite response regulator NarL